MEETLRRQLKEAVDCVRPGTEGWKDSLRQVMNAMAPINNFGRRYVVRLLRRALLEDVQRYGRLEGWSTTRVIECQNDVRDIIEVYLIPEEEEKRKLTLTKYFPSCVTALCVGYFLYRCLHRYCF